MAIRAQNLRSNGSECGSESRGHKEVDKKTEGSLQPVDKRWLLALFQGFRGGVQGHVEDDHEDAERGGEDRSADRSYLCKTSSGVFVVPFTMTRAENLGDRSRQFSVAAGYGDDFRS